jgi:hypothetical protein
VADLLWLALYAIGLAVGPWLLYSAWCELRFRWSCRQIRQLREEMRAQVPASPPLPGPRSRVDARPEGGGPPRAALSQLRKKHSGLALDPHLTSLNDDTYEARRKIH